MNRRNFINLLGCGCISYGLASCTSAPITERKQLKLIPEHKLNAQAAKIYEKIKDKEKLSKDQNKVNEIKEIGSKIEIAISKYFENSNLEDPTKNFNWEYILIDNKKIKNAWCMPGGKIAVYTGILDITKNTNGLAAVMGHEIAHAVAKHSVERASQHMALNVVTQVTDILSGGKLSKTVRHYTSGYDSPFQIRPVGSNRTMAFGPRCPTSRSHRVDRRCDTGDFRPQGSGADPLVTGGFGAVKPWHPPCDFPPRRRPQ